MKLIVKKGSLLFAPLVALWIVFGTYAVASAAHSGVVTMTFDDGNTSQYEIIVPILKAANQKAVFFINSGEVGGETYMTWEQVVELHTSGFEIGGHTLNHIELPTVSQSQMKKQVNNDYANFVAHGITPTNFASPFGAYDNTMLPIVAKIYNSHRAFANQGLNIWPYNKYLIYVRYVTNQTSLEQAKAWVDEAMAQDAWLILVFHEILPVVDPTDDYSWETTKFQSFIDYLNAEGIKAKTVAQVLGGYTNLVTNPSFESGLTGWRTDNARGVTLNTGNNGSYPNPRNAIRISGTAAGAHLFGQKIPVSPASTYGLRAYTDSRALTAGEVGFYIDEYDAAGDWISGKWLGGFTNQNVVDKSYVYKPTSSWVQTAAVQVYMTPGAAGRVFIDNIELFARAENPNLITNWSFEEGLTGWSTNSAEVTLNTENHGGAPLPQNSVKMTGAAAGGHLFGEKIPVAATNTYGLRVYTDSTNLTGGEVGFYIDEYDASGTWISGKWISGFTEASATTRSYTYQPTSAAVITAAVQVYMTPGAEGSVYVDSVEFFIR